jgi:hypothetical protein
VPEQPAGAVDADRQDSGRALPAGARLVAYRERKANGSNGDIAGLAKMKMFPVSPALFLVCSQPWPNEILALPGFWMSCHDAYGRSAVGIRIFNHQEHWEH